MSSEKIPIDENEQREKFFTSIYIQELFEECKYAGLSMAYLRFALSISFIDLVFYSAHSFLNHIGNISKLLWPDSQTKRKWPKSYKRDKELKSLLEIPENSPLKDRLFRNHYEHYDSRIDEWVFNSEHHNMMNRYVGPLNKISGLESGDIMKHFDPITFILTFRGDIYDIKTAEKEVMNLMTKIHEIPHEYGVFR